ncbi:MAG: nuclear transport factor 2 family protein [Rhodospirillaceae bacterium]|nr:nuclear transport factor 2 family protein [Rhodospirillaceae bacterium]
MAVISLPVRSRAPRSVARFALAILPLSVALSSVSFAQTADEVAKAKDEIWAKEKAIYAQRQTGGDYYFNNSAQGYLAWVYGAPKPFRRENLRPKGPPRAVPTKEAIANEFSDFSLQGDTAIIYYVNHRTMLADGTPVDQLFDNIHVWVREGGDWKVIASMSRLREPAKAK